MNTCERPTVASGDPLGPNLHDAFMSQARTKYIKAQRAPIQYWRVQYAGYD